eukprot:15473770-Alexandrium_andersonii.AAC.1
MRKRNETADIAQTAMRWFSTDTDHIPGIVRFPTFELNSLIQIWQYIWSDLPRTTKANRDTVQETSVMAAHRRRIHEVQTPSLSLAIHLLQTAYTGPVGVLTPQDIGVFVFDGENGVLRKPVAKQLRCFPGLSQGHGVLLEHQETAAQVLDSLKGLPRQPHASPLREGGEPPTSHPLLYLL